MEVIRNCRATRRQSPDRKRPISIVKKIKTRRQAAAIASEALEFIPYGAIISTDPATVPAVPSPRRHRDLSRRRFRQRRTNWSGRIPALAPAR